MTFVDTRKSTLLVMVLGLSVIYSILLGLGLGPRVADQLSSAVDGRAVGKGAWLKRRAVIPSCMVANGKFNGWLCGSGCGIVTKRLSGSGCRWDGGWGGAWYWRVQF